MTSAVSKQIECGNAGEGAETGSEERVHNNKPGKGCGIARTYAGWSAYTPRIISPETFQC